MGEQLLTLLVRRWGEDEATPVVLDDRRSCGTASQCIAHGCIALSLSGRGSARLVHLTGHEALRLSDLLRAMVAADVD